MSESSFSHIILLQSLSQKDEDVISASTKNILTLKDEDVITKSTKDVLAIILTSVSGVGTILMLFFR